MKTLFKTLCVATTLAFVAPAGSAVELTARPLAVNESWTESLASLSSLNLTIHDSFREQQRTISTELEVTRETRIVALGGNGEASELEITYVGAEMNDVALPVQGKTYRVEIQGNHVSFVGYAGGAAPPAEEEEFVRRDNRSLDRLSIFNRVFAGIDTDAWVEVPKNLASRLMNADDTMNVESLRVRFRGVSGSGDAAVAEFDAALSLVTPMKKGKKHKESEQAFAGNLRRVFPSGTIRVSLSSCRPVSMTFSGTNNDTVSASRGAHGKPGKHDRMAISGVGSSSLAMTWER